MVRTLIIVDKLFENTAKVIIEVTKILKFKKFVLKFMLNHNFKFITKENNPEI